MRESFLRASVRPWGLVAALGFVVCAATVLGFMGGLAWYLDLFAHFRVQYALALTVAAVVLAAGKRFVSAGVFAVFALVNLAVVAPLYAGPAVQAGTSAKPVRVMLANVRAHRGDPSRVIDTVRQSRVDVVVLEEVTTVWLARVGALRTSHPFSVAQPREDAFGIALFSRLPLANARVVSIGNAGVPSVIAEVRSDDASFTLIGTHPVPPVEAEYAQLRDNQLAALPSFVPSSGPVVVVGDLNTTPWGYQFGRLLQRTRLLDSSRGHGVQPTWPTASLLFGIPLDHCLHSPDVTVVGRRVGPDIGSDHRPLLVDLMVAN